MACASPGGRLLRAALATQAARLVPVYTVDVAERGGSALQEAMRQALVRATGRREAAEDPALATVVANAAQYVKDYGSGARGQPVVLFDGAAVDAAITAAGRTLWDSERPFTLIVLDPPRTRAAADAAHAQLEKVAAERGLPVSVIPLTLVDAGGVPLSREALLGTVQRYGADALLVGRGEGTPAEAALQWTLYTRTARELVGPARRRSITRRTGLRRNPPGRWPRPRARYGVRIDGVNTLTDYASVARLLQASLGVRRVGVAVVDPAGRSARQAAARPRRATPAAPRSPAAPRPASPPSATATPARHGRGPWPVFQPRRHAPRQRECRPDGEAMGH